MAHHINTTNNVINRALDYYSWTLTFKDSRTEGWFFVDSPMPTIMCTVIYLVIVYFGPKYMKSRKPFKLKWLIFLYNVMITGLNGYIAYQMFYAAKRLQYSYVCQPCRESYHPDELIITKAVWWFYISKVIEFCDTFFFILRKKDNQLTFLHIYHHSTMFPLWWIGVKWVPSGSAFLPPLINSTVHVVMYSYYALSTFGPRIERFLWWKKYITMLQLVQFVTALSLGINAVIIGCEFPLWMHYTLIFYMISFIVLFGNFYIKEYIGRAKNKLKKI